MPLQVQYPQSLGSASITAGAVGAFDFSAGMGGNSLIISAEQGGLVRVNVEGADPQATLTTLSADDFFVFVDAGNAVVNFPEKSDTSNFITNVRLRPTSNMVNIGVTLSVIR